MSRIGKLPVPVPDGVTVNIEGSHVAVSGPKGDLEMTAPEGVTLDTNDDGDVVVSPSAATQDSRSRHGLVRSLVANMVIGVTDGYSKRLELVGVGYRAQQKGRDLEFQVGYSHPVLVEAPDGISLEAPAPTQIVVTGVDKQLVGQVAANIRSIRPPEPYKGKGIKYEGEVVRRKAGKAAGR
ncbi:50S ribosomal protein L6 [Salsipaludibacter albus]|uniref:50S ribosomal protein L6 n=1 Tax=Salsipaludibacter albus TaxID=2849650 RepID=UPI001EE438E7|nr:50S ribosomal protein L6 [Salsipaludibacter albus]MBY5161577.1 50S ribosomal protein L6 [Salsipaludibacter albus]